ncbi:MAG: hypothetical protein HQK49_19550 [Oligoflexia bacterium]|nr:hypothetical protein [Oligoflexia bacterium]
MGKIDDFEVEFSRSIKKLMEAMTHLELAIAHQKKIIVDDSRILKDITSKLAEVKKLQNKIDGNGNSNYDNFEEFEEVNELVHAKELKTKINSLLKEMNKLAMHSVEKNDS